MIEIVIDKKLKETAPELTLGGLSATVQNTDHDEQLWRDIEQRSAEIKAAIELDQIGHLPQIAAQRTTYKAMGKDPGRYRGAAEALLRRIAQGKSIYRVNTLVDINNLISLQSYHSIGTYDRAQLQPPITMRIGATGESYQGIGKGEINIDKLPVFTDLGGPFGSPTSDSRRALIKPESQAVLMILVAFNGDKEMEHTLRQAVTLLKRYAAAENIETRIIG